MTFRAAVALRKEQVSTPTPPEWLGDVDLGTESGLSSTEEEDETED